MLIKNIGTIAKNVSMIAVKIVQILTKLIRNKEFSFNAARVMTFIAVLHSQTTILKTFLFIVIYAKTKTINFVEVVKLILITANSILAKSVLMIFVTDVILRK